MNRLRLLLAAGLLLGACQKNETGPQEPEDPDWLRLTVPTNYTRNADEAYAVAGSLNQTLLVATKIAIYSSADQGQSWQASRQSAIRTWGLLERGDTVFVLGTGTTDQQGHSLAISADDFTTNYGRTWTGTGVLPPPFDPHALQLPIGRVAKAGVAYELVPIKEPITATSYRILGYDLLRTAGARQTKVRLPLPHRHYLNLHLDARNYLYVTASGFLVDDVTNEIVPDKTAASTAVVYVSRRPLP